MVTPADTKVKCRNVTGFLCWSDLPTAAKFRQSPLPSELFMLQAKLAGGWLSMPWRLHRS